MNYFYTAVASALIGAGVYAWLMPVKTKIEYKDKVVVQNQIKTVVRTVQKQDGTVETVQETVDTSTSTANRQYSKQVVEQKQWLVGVQFGLPVRGFEPANGLRIERHVGGPLFAGAYAKTSGEVGFSLSWMF